MKPLAPMSEERGATLVITLLVMLLVFVLGSALATSMLAEIASSANYRSRGESLWQAESGLERTAVDLLADPDWARQMVDYSTIPMVVTASFPVSSTFNGETVNYDLSGGAVVPKYYDLGGVVVLDNGSFQRQIFMPPISIAPANGSGTKARLVIPIGATGFAGLGEPSTSRVRSDMSIVVRRLTVWDNAVFGGAGQGGNSINGNVQVRGSMHIIGEATDVIESNGTAWVMNSYQDLLADYGPEGAKLPALPLQDINGEMVQTLDAEVRVKHGTINLGGFATWGLPDVTGNAFKETLDGFYNDATLNLSGSASVNYDEVGNYDAVDIAFPTLDDPYFDAATSTLYASHRGYLNANSLLLPVNEISVDTPAFNLDDGNGNSAQWNPGSGELRITGIVRTNGDLDIAKKNNPVDYRGTGTLFANGGSVHIHDNLLPTGDYLDTGSPNVHNLGIIADTNLEIATGPGESAIKVMAAMYAEEYTNIAKQTNVAGAIVADSFDLGNQVPSVWQVPKLGVNLPPGMPGSDPLLFVTGADITNWYHVRR